MHGWGITLHIQGISNEVLRVEEGSLYPALHRMEQERWIKAEWAASENNRRARYYRLTLKRRKQLAEEERSWQRLTQAVAAVLTSLLTARDARVIVGLLSRFVTLFRPSKVREIDEELRFHIEMRKAANIESGMSPEDAQLDAKRRFGNATVLKERTRD